MSKTEVHLQIDGRIATITFSTESGINVMGTSVLHSFGAEIAKVRKNPDVRAAVIQAEGKVFVAGADIKAMSSYSPEQAREYGQLGQDVLNDLESLPMLTIAALNGAALGGGLELALACDFRIAAKAAKLGLPEVVLGLIPGWGGIPRLNRLVGPSRAKRLFMSGSAVSAEQAHEFGLVNEVVPTAEDLTPRVNLFLKEFSRASLSGMALAKRALRDCDDLTAFAECFTHGDSREGMSAFIEKRPASWVEEK